MSGRVVSAGIIWRTAHCSPDTTARSIIAPVVEPSIVRRLKRGRATPARASRHASYRLTGEPSARSTWNPISASFARAANSYASWASCSLQPLKCRHCRVVTSAAGLAALLRLTSVAKSDRRSPLRLPRRPWRPAEIGEPVSTFNTMLSEIQRRDHSSAAAGGS